MNKKKIVIPKIIKSSEFDINLFINGEWDIQLSRIHFIYSLYYILELPLLDLAILNRVLTKDSCRLISPILISIVKSGRSGFVQKGLDILLNFTISYWKEIKNDLKIIYECLLDLAKMTAPLIPKAAILTIDSLVKVIPETNSLFNALNNRMDKPSDKLLTVIGPLLQLAISRDCFREQSIINPIVVSTSLRIIETLSNKKIFEDSVKLIVIAFEEKCNLYDTSKTFIDLCKSGCPREHFMKFLELCNLNAPNLFDIGVVLCKSTSMILPASIQNSMKKPELTRAKTPRTVRAPIVKEFLKEVKELIVNEDIVGEKEFQLPIETPVLKKNLKRLMTATPRQVELDVVVKKQAISVNAPVIENKENIITPMGDVDIFDQTPLCEVEIPREVPSESSHQNKYIQTILQDKTNHLSIINEFKGNRSWTAGHSMDKLHRKYELLDKCSNKLSKYDSKTLKLNDLVKFSENMISIYKEI